MILRDIKQKDKTLLCELDRRPEVENFIGTVQGLLKIKEGRVKVIETDDGILAGVVAVFKSDAMDGRDQELLCALLKNHEGSGLATEACRAMLDEVFDDPSVHRVIGCIDLSNQDSLGLIKRLGGTFLQDRDVPVCYCKKDVCCCKKYIYTFKRVSRQQDGWQ
jgi:RimJ/RimL family protein N-acetyltransferase